MAYDSETPRRWGWTDTALFVLCGLLSTGCGCSTDIDCSLGPIFADAGYDDDDDDYDEYDAGDYCDVPANASVDGDLGVLSAAITCEPGFDCGVPSRDILRGSTLQYRFVVPPTLITNIPEVESSDPDRVEVTVGSLLLACGGLELTATVHFKELGEAAIIVRDATRELDRFTTTTHELARLELVVPSDDGDGGVADDVALQEITVDEPLRVELVLRSESGAALIGGTEAQWSIFNEGIASFDYGAMVTPRERVIVPHQLGQTILRVRSNGLFLILGVYVTGVDGGTIDDDDMDGGTDH